MATIEQVLLSAQNALITATLTDSPKLDAELLLADALQRDRTYLFTWSDRTLSDSEQQAFAQRLQLRLDGQPVAHIIGHREFWGLTLKVTADTLIPRPDTETLIEAVLDLKLPQKADILDMGTGTGAIALAIKSERPQANVNALDLSLKALSVAKENAANHHLDITFHHSSWFENMSEQSFDCIVTNPPYIEECDPHLSQGDVRFEPITALTSGEDGLDDIRLIIRQAKSFLNPDGWLVIEHGYNQAQAVKTLFMENGYKDYQLKIDLGGNPRISYARF